MGFCDGKGALRTSPMASNQSSVFEASLGKELPTLDATDLSSITTKMLGGTTSARETESQAPRVLLACSEMFGDYS